MSNKSTPNYNSGKLPPQAVEAEQTILGALLIERDAIKRVESILKPEIFYKAQHQYIYQAICELHADKAPIDMITVGDRLKANGKFQASGGAYYLADLASKVASAANLEAHSWILLNKYLLRETVRITGDAQRDAWEETTDVVPRIDKLIAELGSLTEIIQPNKAERISDFYATVIANIEKKGNKKGFVGVPTGLIDLDNRTGGFQADELITVAGSTSMGKTSLEANMAVGSARLGYETAVVLLEITTQSFMQKIISAECEISSYKFRTGTLNADDWDRIQAKQNEIYKLPLYIHDKAPIFLNDLCSLIRMLVKRHGVKSVYIDYIQLIQIDNIRLSDKERITIITRTLKNLQLELGIPIIGLAQLSRDVKHRKDKRPILSDLADSASIERDSNIVIFVHRPEYYNIMEFEDHSSTKAVAEIIIAKFTNGATGDFRLNFIDKYAKFTNYAETETKWGQPACAF